MNALRNRFTDYSRFNCREVLRARHGYSSTSSMLRRLTLFLVLIVGGSSVFAETANNGQPEATGGSIEGLITLADQTGKTEAVPGVVVKLTSASSASAPLVCHNGRRGPL